MLLIITNRHDLASDYLILRLKDRGISFARFNTDQYPAAAAIDIAFQGDGPDYALHLENGVKLCPDAIGAVYFRQPIAPTFESAASEAEQSFAEAELLETLRSLWRMIPQDLWLNHPKQLWIASNKVEQLKAARMVGLQIPDTLISSSSDRILPFLKKHRGRVVAKAVRHGFVRSGDEVLLAGTRHLPEGFASHIDEFAPLPMVYQEEIDKAADIRVVVVGDRVFPARILVKTGPRTADWRVSDIMGADLHHERASLPQHVEQKCLSLVRHFGLAYSSIDLVEDRQERFFFLELNPNGQWAWIEQTVGYPIRDAIIDTLCHGDR